MRTNQQFEHSQYSSLKDRSRVDNQLKNDGKNVGFIIRRRKVKSEMDEQYPQTLLQTTSVTPKLNHYFSPHPKQKLPTIGKTNNRISTQDVSKDSVSLTKQFIKEDYRYGRRTRKRAQQKYKKQSPLQQGSNKINNQKLIRKELEELVIRKKKLQHLYGRKHQLKHKLQKLEKQLKGIRKVQRQFDQEQKENAKLKNKSRKNKINNEEEEEKNKNQEDGREMKKEREEKTQQNKNQQKQKKINEKDCESSADEFHSHGSLNHKCLECRQFELKIEDVHIPRK